MSEEMVGLIAAGGLGSRLYPESKKTSKVLLMVDGQPLITRILAIMRDQLNIRRVFVIVGQNRWAVKHELKNGESFGVSISYIDNPQPEKGLAHGVRLARSHISGRFCLMLSDEFYDGSDHQGLTSYYDQNWDAVCMIKKGASPWEVKKNYTVTIENQKITGLIEKPESIGHSLLGCGTFLLNPGIFDAIDMIVPSPRTEKKELLDAVDFLVRQGKTVLPHFTKGDYVNVNTADDLNLANYLMRGSAFNQKKISLVIPAWNEEDSIGYVIDDFKDKVHEIVVADNMSTDRTAQVAKEKGALVFSDVLKGYGDAIRYGLSKASGDILVVTEADGSFTARDLGKILEYMKDADMVIGTRTTRQMIEQGANMTLFLRVGNVAVAKIIEILWWKYHEPRLTDVGCTYRAIWKHAYLRIKDDLKADGPALSPEMIIEPIRHYLRIIEIPVSYHGRIGGESKHSADIKASLKTGFSMLLLIFKKKLKYLWIDDFKGWIKNMKSRQRLKADGKLN